MPEWPIHGLDQNTSIEQLESKHSDQNNFQIAAAMPARSSRLIMMALTHGQGDEYLRPGADLAPMS